MMSRKWAVRIIAALLAVIMVLGVVVVALQAFASDGSAVAAKVPLYDTTGFKVVASLAVIGLAYLCSRIALRLQAKIHSVTGRNDTQIDSQGEDISADESDKN